MHMRLLQDRASAATQWMEANATASAKVRQSNTHGAFRDKYLALQDKFAQRHQVRTPCPERSLSFELADGFDWNSALVVEDIRQDYSEIRYQALGKIDGRLYMLVFTIRDETIRAISLRKANSREAIRYEKAQS